MGPLGTGGASTLLASSAAPSWAGRLARDARSARGLFRGAFGGWGGWRRSRGSRVWLVPPSCATTSAVEPMEAQVSHILLTSTTAALQGELAFARVMARFTGANRAGRLVDNVTSVLDEARKWWKDLDDGIPLIRTGPEVTVDGERVSTLLR